MQFIDLHSQYLSIQKSVESRIKKILNHGQYILGPEVTELETTLAQRTKTSFCVSTSSGTVSLEIALRALEIGPGDEVITVPFSFFSTNTTQHKTPYSALHSPSFFPSFLHRVSQFFNHRHHRHSSFFSLKRASSRFSHNP